MKRFWVVALLMFAHVVCYGRDTAYQALRVIGGGDNQAVLNHVIQVRGSNGESQPASWHITVDDPNARGGVREFEVAGGRVVSEHAPVRAYAGTGSSSAMDFKQLNLDSEGAFNIANQEAGKRHVAFDSVDYLLRGDEQTNAPLWVLKLIDADKVNVGTIYIAADTGAVIRTDGFTTAVRRDVQDTYVPPEHAVTTSPRTDDIDNDNQDDVPNGKGAGYKINKGFHEVGASLQEFFTGRRTWDQRFRDDH
jgi:hypothetical protein